MTSFSCDVLQQFCSKETKELLELIVRTDPHSPGRFRLFRDYFTLGVVIFFKQKNLFTARTQFDGRDLLVQAMRLNFLFLGLCHVGCWS